MAGLFCTGHVMPAAPLDVNWEAVRAHAVIHGIRPTAEHYGIAPGTLLARSSKEGWLKPVREAQAAMQSVAINAPATMQPKAVKAITPAEAAQNALLGYSGKTKLKLAKATHKGATTIAKQPGEAIIAQAQQLKALTDTADKLHGWSKSGDTQPLVNITIGSAAQAPVIDVTDI